PASRARSRRSPHRGRLRVRAGARLPHRADLLVYARVPGRPSGPPRPHERGVAVDRIASASLYGTAMVEQTESRALRLLREIVESGRPLVYVRSAEEQRVTALLREVARRLFSPPAPLWVWSLTEGMRRDGSGSDGKVLAPRAALDFVASFEGPAVFL